MNIKTVFLKDLKDANDVQTSLMVMKKLYSDNNKYVCILGDKTGDIISSIKEELDIEKPGNGIVFVQNINEVYGLYE